MSDAPAVLRIVFPNVEGDSVRPIEISVRAPLPIDPGRQGRLTVEEIEALRLDEISLACALLEIPGLRVFRSWAIDWGSGGRPALNGRSAQLAALLAYLAGVRGKRARPRGWLRASPDIWATGSIVLGEDPAEPTVESWSDETSRPDPSILQKFDAFARSSGAVMFVPASESRHLEARAGQAGIRTVSVAEFRGIAKAGRGQSGRYLVVVAPADLRAFVDAVLEGVFPRGPGFWVANAFTASRIPCGLVAAWLALQGRMNEAASVYVAGLLTDVADGVFARLMHGTSEFGKKFDRRVDMGFNLATGLGLCAASYRATGPGETLAVLGLTVGFMLATRLAGAQPHSGFAKLRSGWIRAVLLGFLMLHMNWNLGAAEIVAAALAGLALVAVSAYEIEQVRRDVATGRRGWLWGRKKK